MNKRLRQKRINEIEKQMDVLFEKDEVSQDEKKQLKALEYELAEIDPFNDIFHLGCPNWPNCDIEGCGESRVPGHWRALNNDEN